MGINAKWIIANASLARSYVSLINEKSIFLISALSELMHMVQ